MRMRSGRVVSKLTAVTVFVVLSSTCMVTAESAKVKSTSDSSTAFGLDLYGQFKSTQGNLFFSPYSISTCLGMTYAGARGNTEMQMARVMHFPKDQPQVHSAFGELQRELNAAGKQQGIE